MNGLKLFGLASVAVICFAIAAPHTRAQVSVNIGVAPECPYGYYDVSPYDCAPYGYYGPQWFAGGVFIGAGPWYHGWHGPYGYYGHGPYGYGRGYYGRGYYGRGYYRPGAYAYRGGAGYARGGAGYARGGFARGAGGGFHGGGGH